MMDRTPKRSSKLSLKNNECTNSKVVCSIASTASSTPIQEKPSTFFDDYSPSFVPCTQEAYDQLDVVWDWNSPKSQTIPKNPKPKRLQPRSPKPIVKKYSNNQPVVNENLKNELEKLKNQLETERKPSSSKLSSKNLILESTSNTFKNNNQILSSESTKSSELEISFSLKDELKDIEDLFDDDSMEEELILQSQKIENLVKLQLKDGGESKTEFRKFKSEDRLGESYNLNGLKMKSNSSGELYESPRQKPSASVKLELKFDATFNDSFDLAIEKFKESDLKLNNSGNKSLNVRSKSNGSLSMSFEDNISWYDKQEIERKRQEALAKLRSKKLHNVISPSKRSHDNLHLTSETNCQKVPKVEESPIKCSPEEIEQKRLQALAKLEAKKKQDIIEKNKREALKRLEMNKKKREMLLNNIRS